VVLDSARPHTPTMPAVGRGRGDAAGSVEVAAGRARGGSAACLSPPAAHQRLARVRWPRANGLLEPIGQDAGEGCCRHEVGGWDAMEAAELEGRRQGGMPLDPYGGEEAMTMH
jgi:hypothetical protein